MSDNRKHNMLWILFLCLHLTAGHTFDIPQSYLELLLSGFCQPFFYKCLPPQDLHSFAIISSTSTEQSSKACHHQLIGSFFQQMQTAFRNSSLLDILGTTSSHMEEPTAATLAKVWCFADSDIDRVSSRHILGNNAPFQASTRT